MTKAEEIKKETCPAIILYRCVNESISREFDKYNEISCVYYTFEDGSYVEHERNSLTGEYRWL